MAETESVNEFMHRFPPYFQNGGPIRVWTEAPANLDWSVWAEQHSRLAHFIRHKLNPVPSTEGSLALQLRNAFPWVAAVEVLDGQGNGVICYNKWP